MREIDSTCRQDLFVKNKLCSSTQMFIKFKLLSGKRVYVFANLFVWASSGGKFAKCDGIWIFGNGFFDKPKSISIGSGYQFWQSRFPTVHIYIDKFINKKIVGGVLYRFKYLLKTSKRVQN